jgi:hypothetical protein
MTTGIAEARRSLLSGSEMRMRKVFSLVSRSLKEGIALVSLSVTVAPESVPGTFGISSLITSRVADFSATAS